MKFLYLIITLFAFTNQSLDLKEVRDMYRDAAHDKSKVEAFYIALSPVKKEDAVTLVAYKGASIALKARGAKTIKEKKEGFVEGATLLEYAIQKEPNAIEPRFIRLGIQENTPKLLGYKEDIDKDKLFLLKQYSSISSINLKNHIKDYILQSTLFTPEEKDLVRN